MSLTGKVDPTTYERLCTQVKLALAERPNLTDGTPDGLRKMDDPPKSRLPIGSGVAAGVAGAGTIGLGMAADGSDGSSAPADQATDVSKTTTTVVTTDTTTGATIVTPVQPPANAGAAAPTKTTASVGMPGDAGPITRPGSWSDPVMALAISLGFIATVVLAAWFFRKTTHT